MTILQSTLSPRANVEKGLDKPPWIKTPCIFSEALSVASGCQVYAKLDLLQPSGSFKSRGVGNFVWQTAKEADPVMSRSLHFYSSSRGNAGIAAAMAARQAGQRATVVVPEMTDRRLIARIESVGGRVIVWGESLAQADEYARAEVQASDNRIYVSPYDHEKIWHGNSSIIDELFEQFEGEPPDVIICSVGGGGLLNGIMLGLDRYGWNKSVTVLALETEGADCLSQAIQADRQVTLTSSTSIAKSLGVPCVSSRTLGLFKQRSNIYNVVLSDADAARACVRFADDHKMMVEPACGVSMALCYNGMLNRLIPNLTMRSRVVVVACGGANIDLNTLQEYDTKYGCHGDESGAVFVNNVLKPCWKR